MNFYKIHTSHFFKFISVTLILLELSFASFSQSGNCDPSTPFFSVDLTGFPNGVWTSPAGQRVGNCCGTLAPDKCIEISITLDTDAVAINFQIASGAVPPGALFYQIGCGPPVAVGSPICLNGPGPYTLTFCKPGNNINTYSITSIAAPAVSPDDTIGDGCSTTMYASGLFVNSSINWTSIYPGATGEYNSFLSCITACDSTVVVGTPAAPPFVDYVVCGMPLAGICAAPGLFCDTIRIHFSPPILNPVNPNPAILCTNTSGILLTGTAVGGVPPYTFAWTNGANGTGTVVGTGLTYMATAAGAYSFIVYDQNYPKCPARITNTPVTISPITIANAGPDQTICSTVTTLGANTPTDGTGAWSLVSGTAVIASPNAPNSLVTGLVAGSSCTLRWTISNGFCPPSADDVVIMTDLTPTTANAGADQTICGATLAALSANTPSIGTGIWTIVSGPLATITNPASPSTTVTGLVPGATYVFKWTISNGACPPSFDNVTIHVDLMPTTANAGPDQIHCGLTTAALAANIPIVGTGMWSVILGTATITTPSSATSGVTGLLPGTSVILRWTITQGFCSNSDDVTLTLNQPSIVNAGPDQSMCMPSNIQLNGTVSGGSSTGIWTTMGSGTFVPNSSTLNPLYVLSSNDIANGNVFLVLTSTNNSATCGVVTDTVKINFAGFNGTVSTTVTNVQCYGGTNGSAVVNIAGGISPFTYFWNTVPVQTAQIATGLAQGTYSVTITDAHGCSSQTSVNITQPQLLALNSVITNVSCTGGNNGGIVIIPTGGTAPYTFLWQPGNQTTASISNLQSGTYSLTVTDAKNCLINSVYSVIQPLPLSLSFTTTNVNCFNGNTGSIHSIVSGGTLPYLYSWNPSGATSPDIIGVQAGTYSLTVTDNKGCVLINSVAITQPADLSTSLTSTNETCNYLNNGTAAVSASGGTPSYSYLWMPGNLTTASVTNLSNGTYTLTVTDSKGCSKGTFVTITEPAALSVNFINQLNVSCFGGSNGSVTAGTSGGTPAYTYLWIPGNMNTASINNLQQGTYTVNITDNNNCHAQNNVTITQPVSVLSASIASTPVSCNGGTNGSLTSIASGGTGPYTYNWMPGNYNGQTISNVAGGSYTVTVTDSRGCTFSNFIPVNQPSQIIPVTGTTNSNCSLPNGTAFVTVSGGTSPYTYQWLPGGGNNASATGLLSGAYSVIVTDANGCNATQYANVNDNTGPSVNIISTTNVSCHGGFDGTATATVSGTGPFIYSWIPYGGIGPIATGLGAGIFTLTVFDNNGCQSLATTSPPISEPPVLVVSVTNTNVSCFGGSNGSATASASGGTPGYSYQWFPSGSIGNSINNLSAGTYTVQVSDAHNCVQTLSAIISQPTPLAAAISSSTNVSCFGGNNGTATVNVNGGTPFYNYSWLPTGGNGSTGVGLHAGTYTVNISDSKNCTASILVVITQPSQVLSASSIANPVSCFGGSDGSATVNPAGGTPGYLFQWAPSGGTGQTASGLISGNYFVLVTDNLGCQTNLSLNISQPSPINITLVSTNPSCSLPNGFISSQVSGGTGPYTYLWQPISSSNPSLNALTSGTYTLQVRDSKNCLSTSSAILTNIAGPVVSVSSINNVSCYGGNNGSATVSINLGTAPYSINWSPYGGNNLTATSLTSGNYSVHVIDALGCQSNTVATITQPQPLILAISSISNVSCNGGSNGAVTVFASGGTPAYSYSWQPFVSSSPTVNNLAAGTFIVHVSDQNNCTNSVSVNITQPGALSSSVINATNTTCYSGSNGSATVVGAGGTIPYSYLWSTIPAQTGSTAINLSANSYSVVITDSKGCTITQTVMITQPTQVITTAGANDTICFGQSGTLTATAAGGGGNYFYTWQPSGEVNAGLINVTPITNVTYTVTASDQSGCSGTSATISAIVNNLAAANIQAIANSPICPGQSSDVYIQISGTTGVLNYLWNNGLGNGAGPYTVTPAQPTTYIVTVTNSCGVSVTDSVRILFNPPPTMVLGSDINSGCAPANIQFNDNSITGNVNDPIISWLWNFGDGTSSTAQNPVHHFPQSGVYPVTLTVTTQGGCTNNNATDSIIITIYPIPVASFSVNSTHLTLPLDELICSNQSVGADTYFWSFGDGGSSTTTNPHYFYTSVGVFQVQLIAKSQYGCSDTAFTEVTTDADVVFPNVFTPNTNNGSGGFYDPGSLDNDIFFPYVSGVVDFKMEIFDRWGELIFESLNINQGWDGYYRGQLCQQDVYIWKAYMKLNNGKVMNKNGDITLLR